MRLGGDVDEGSESGVRIMMSTIVFVSESFYEHWVVVQLPTVRPSVGGRGSGCVDSDWITGRTLVGALAHSALLHVVRFNIGLKTSA